MGERTAFVDGNAEGRLILNESEADLPPGLRTRPLGESPATALRERLAEGAPLLLPGITDCITARIAQSVGFDACYLTGAGFANIQFGLPDVGLISMNEVVTQAARIVDGINIPVIVDADTGYGGPLAVMRTLHLLEKAGVAGMQIEDQADPKRCGHFDRKRLIDLEEMLIKIDAALKARRNEDFVLVARTDARGVDGLEEAISRGKAYAEAGADVVFIEAPHSMEEIKRIGSEFRDVPLLISVVEGGRTPAVPLARLDELGFNVVLYANFVQRAMLRAGQLALKHLWAEGDSEEMIPDILPWRDRQELVNLPAFDEVEDGLRSARGNDA